MTHSYLVLKKLDGFKTKNEQLAQLKLEKDEQILMSENSAEELEIDQLVKAGYLKKLTEDEALANYKINNK